MNAPLIIERTYNAPIQLVWKALSDNNEMKKWYFQLPEFKPEVGFQFQFNGTSKDGKPKLHLCQVTEVVPGKKLTYSWAYAGVTGISFVTWELFAEGEKTRLKLTHAGLDTFPKENQNFARENFEGGWATILGTWLKEFVESASLT